MKNNVILGINFDEISDNFDTACNLMEELGVQYAELRTLNGKNFVFWTDEEVASFKQAVANKGLTLVAAATPLFKWYTSPDDPEVQHDSFGFNPRLSSEEKQSIIKRAIQIATTLSIPKLRIFSELGESSENAGTVFAQNELLDYALQQAAAYNIDLYIENEPVCRIHTKSQLVSFLQNNQNKNLKLWLDIANLLELGEDIDDEFLAAVSSRIGYIHVKDFVLDNGVKKYVPVGQGDVDYTTLLPRILAYCPPDITITIETHATTDKVKASRLSLQYMQSFLDKYEGR